MQIVLQGAGYSYGPRPVLKDISLQIGEGELVGIIGPNGSGKSTLLRLIGGALQPNPGQVLLGGRESWRIKPRELAQIVARVGQELPSEFSFPVQEVVMMGRMSRLGRFSREGPEDWNVVCKALEVTGTIDLAERPLTQISGGERQRVFLAQALAQEPQVLLLDEPTSHLDIKYQLELFQILAGLARTGMTILAVLHDLNLAAAYAHRILLLDRGEMAAWGGPREVLTQERINRVYQTPVVVTEHPATGAQVVLPYLPGGE